MEIRQTYRYQAEAGSTLQDASYTLFVLRFDDEFHLSLLTEDLHLMAYEIYTSGDISLVDTYKSFFYKWISVTGVVPANVRLVSAKDAIWLLPAFQSKGEAWKDLPIFSNKQHPRKTQFKSDYDLIYFRDELFWSALKDVFPVVDEIPYPKLMDGFFQELELLPEYFCHLVCMPGKMALWAQESNKLLSFIQKEFGDKNDLLYFCMKMYEHFDWDPGSVPLFVSGLISPQSSFVNHLKAYFSTVVFMELPGFSAINLIPDFFDSTSAL